MLLIPGSNNPNICLPKEARAENGLSLGDTEEMRGQTYCYPDFQDPLRFFTDNFVNALFVGT